MTASKRCSSSGAREHWRAFRAHSTAQGHAFPVGMRVSFEACLRFVRAWTLCLGTFAHARQTFIIMEHAMASASSMIARGCAWIEAMGQRIARALRSPRLTDMMPPPCIGESSHDSALNGDPNVLGERMLLDIMRAPPDYVDAAALIVRATHALHKRGDDVLAEGFVVFALSRMVPDSAGTITIKRLREHVGSVPAAKGVVPVLLRLQDQGVVDMDVPANDTAKSRVMNMDHVRITLLIVP